MNKRLIGICIGLLFVTIFLSGCFDNYTTSSDIKGIWYFGSYEVWDFKDEGILSIYKTDENEYDNTTFWDMDSSYLYLIYGDVTEKIRYSLLNDGNILLLEYGTNIITLNRNKE
jgi:hypothetical protein